MNPENPSTMKTQHTPGPWAHEPLQSTQGADIAIVSLAAGFVVATIQHDPEIQIHDEPDGNNVVYHPDDKANACLIAAAPDLLAMLRTFQSVPMAMVAFAHAHPDKMVELSELIAKATGKDEPCN